MFLYICVSVYQGSRHLLGMVTLYPVDSNFPCWSLISSITCTWAARCVALIKAAIIKIENPALSSKISAQASVHTWQDYLSRCVTLLPEWWCHSVSCPLPLTHPSPEWVTAAVWSSSSSPLAGAEGGEGDVTPRGAGLPVWRPHLDR